jgi:hypothetical protein
MRSNLRNLEQERQHLLGFLSTLSDAPVGVACIGGRPDLLIRSGGGIIGIEHTRLFHSTGQISLTQDNLQDQIVREAWTQYRKQGGPPRSVDIYFHDGKLQKRDIRLYAERIRTFVAQLALARGESRHVEAWAANRYSTNTLPPQIESIWIDAVDGDEDSLWGVARSGVVPELTRELVESRINTKESHITEYRSNCTSLWLLLVADGFTPATHFRISDQLGQEPIGTGFDRLFVFHYFKRELIEIPTSIHR